MSDVRRVKIAKVWLKPDGWVRGSDHIEITSSGESDFIEDNPEGEWLVVPVDRKPADVTCVRCVGSGLAYMTDDVPCTACNGTGWRLP